MTHEKFKKLSDVAKVRILKKDNKYRRWALKILSTLCDETYHHSMCYKNFTAVSKQSIIQSAIAPILSNSHDTKTRVKLDIVKQKSTVRSATCFICKKGRKYRKNRNGELPTVRVTSQTEKT